MVGAGALGITDLVGTIVLDGIMAILGVMDLAGAGTDL
jgi:hypothetical protein